jgi:MFS family permease
MIQNTGWREKLHQHPSVLVMRIRDFRLLWIGSFFSFFGSWIQNVAQGWLVYELTGDKAKLAMVGFFATIPVAILGPFMGAFADKLNKRRVLIICQTIFGVSALSLAIITYLGVVRYEHILLIALINGVASSVEMPTRQSVVSRVVPREQIHAAVPLNAMTFNMARILGPALGGWLLHLFGAFACYLFNGLSYLALIIAVLAIRSDMKATPGEAQPIKDLLLEGMRYTWKDIRLRMLFLMEMTVSIFALFYLNLMPAIVKDVLKLDERGLGTAMSSIGFGAMIGLVTVSILSPKPYKSHIIGTAMFVIGIALVIMANTTVTWISMFAFGLAGASAVAQFNTTNALFQTIAPERLRGRVLAMHVWALSGLGPLSLPLFGNLAQHWGIRETLNLGAACVLIAAVIAFLLRGNLAGVDAQSQAKPVPE